MNKFLVGLAAVATTAALILIPTMAQAQTAIAKSGNYDVVLLADNTTCALGTADETHLFLMSYNAVGGDDLRILVHNSDLSFTVGGGYYLDVVLDGQTVRLQGEGVSGGEGKSGVMAKIPAEQAVAAYVAMKAAKELTFKSSTGAEIVALASDESFDNGFDLLVACGTEAAKPAAPANTAKTTA